MYRRVHAGAQPRLKAREQTFDDPVKAERPEVRTARLCTDPAVIVKKHGLFPVPVYDRDKLRAAFLHIALDELPPGAPESGFRPVCRRAAAVIQKILQLNGVPLRRERIQRRVADREIIGRPVCKSRPVFRVRSPNPDKIIKKRGKSYHVRVRMCAAPRLHPVSEIGPRFRIEHFKRHQVLAAQIIRHGIVHGDLFPDTVGEKGHGIGVIGDGLQNHNRLRRRVVAPRAAREFFSRRAVEDLPVGKAARGVIRPELLRVVFPHDRNRQRLPERGKRCGEKEGLLQAMRMLLQPRIMAADHTDRRVNFIIGIQQTLR